MKIVSVLLSLVFSLSSVLGGEKMETRIFHAPPDLLQLDHNTPATQPAAPTDPFVPATSPAPPQERPSALKILEAQGILFPEGSRASFDPSTGTLRVTNTKANLDLVEAFVDSIKGGDPRNNLSFHLQTFQLPAAAADPTCQVKAIAAQLETTSHVASNCISISPSPSFTGKHEMIVLA